MSATLMAFFYIVLLKHFEVGTLLKIMKLSHRENEVICLRSQLVVKLPFDSRLSDSRAHTPNAFSSGSQLLRLCISYIMK